ncbi:MAG: 2-amino-4-hydroxy-6-hydroxymethyldihydropteridine diphosphokinase [Treponema sp.]|nr:2-amino-4-hydroxy-6-hydroxymethyldihydropteridine diphosphokinase [Treponema sp.]
MDGVVLGLGSNRSYNGKSPVQLLSEACSMIAPFLPGMICSPVYRTAAMYVENQDDFYNMVVSGSFDGTPRELLDKIHAVEKSLGRDRSLEFRNGPRSLDVDIELFGNLVVHETDLIVPHERFFERAFVLVPLLDILRENADSNRNSIECYELRLKSLGDQRISLECPPFSL